LLPLATLRATVEVLNSPPHRVTATQLIHLNFQQERERERKPWRITKEEDRTTTFENTEVEQRLVALIFIYLKLILEYKYIAFAF
jgi:hypothetical protein